MKKYLSLLIVVFLFASCKSDSEFSISPGSLEFDSSASSKTVAVAAPSGEDWDILVPDACKDWVTAEKGSGKITISVKVNQGADERGGVVSIKPKNTKFTSKTVTIKQLGSSNPLFKDLVIEPSSLTFASTAAIPQEVAISSLGGNIEWNASVEDAAKEWLHISLSGSKIIVTADDYKSTAKQRIGNIKITPTDKTIPSKAIRVVQKELVLEPSLELSSSEDIKFKFTDSESKPVVIGVKAVNTKWSARLVDVNDAPIALDWLRLGINNGEGSHSIHVYVQSNSSTDSREAYILVMPEVTSIPVVKIKVLQEGKQDVHSTLTGDVTLDLGKSLLFARPHQSWEPAKISGWDNRFMGTGVTYNKNMGVYAGTGDRLMIYRLFTKGFPFNEDQEYFLDAGTYTIVFNSAEYLDQDPGTIKGGYLDEIGRDMDTWYFRMEDGKIVDKAPIVGGTLVVTKNGTKMKFDFNFVDDAGNKITGVYEAAIDINQEGVPYDI